MSLSLYLIYNYQYYIYRYIHGGAHSHNCWVLLCEYCTFLNWYILIFPLGITGGFIGHNAVAGDDITSNCMASASISLHGLKTLSQRPLFSQTQLSHKVKIHHQNQRIKDRWIHARSSLNGLQQGCRSCGKLRQTKWMDPYFFCPYRTHLWLSKHCWWLCRWSASRPNGQREQKWPERMRLNGFDRRIEHWYLILDSWFLIDFQPICSRVQG